MELELPRLLAPDLPSNCSSLRDLNCTHSNYETRKGPILLFIVTTSPCRVWVICAPAAFLGCGSRFSGSLSGIEPWFPVTRYDHGRRVTYHRQLIRQTLERYVAGTSPCDQPKVIQSHHVSRTRGPIGFGLIKALVPEGRSSAACISSRIATVIQVVKYDPRNHNWFNEPFAVSP